MALEKEIEQFRQLRPRLEAESMGKWALIRNDDLVGTYDSFDVAATEAVRRFGRGPYLIRRIGAPEITLPASVVYSVAHATD